MAVSSTASGGEGRYLKPALSIKGENEKNRRSFTTDYWQYFACSR